MALLRVAALPGGLELNVHEISVMATPFGSLDWLPFSVALEPTGSVCAGPALAIGGCAAALAKVHCRSENAKG